MRLFSNPNKTSSGFPILPTGKCNRKKFFLDATALTASSKKAGYDAERGKNRKPVRADVDCVSNAAMGSTIKIFRRKKLKTTESETSAVASAARSWTDICASTVEAISGQLSISRHFCRHCGESLTLTRSRASVPSTINILRDCATSIRISCAKLHKIQSRGATQSISVVPVIEAILRQVLSFFFPATRTH